MRRFFLRVRVLCSSSVIGESGAWGFVVAVLFVVARVAHQEGWESLRSSRYGGGMMLYGSVIGGSGMVGVPVRTRLLKLSGRSV